MPPTPPPPAGDAGWITAVLEYQGSRTALLAMQPADEESHRAAASRLRRGGWERVYPPQFARAAWPAAPAGALDVVDGRLLRVTTGTASFYAAESDLDVTPLWAAAAQSRRALVSLVLPGTFSVGQPLDSEQAWQVLAASARLLCATVQVRFDAYTGPLPSSVLAYRDGQR